MADLATCIDHVERALADADRAAGTYAGDPGGWHARHRLAMEQCRAELAESIGAAFSYKAAHDHYVRIAGIRSSSTSGFAGALSNWLKAARSRQDASHA